MELKTKEDFVKAFIAAGKKYGFATLKPDSGDIDKIYYDIPEDLGDKCLYIVEKTTARDGETYIEHITEEWDRSWEDYVRCEPYDIEHKITYEDTKQPVYIWMVKPSYLTYGKPVHIVRDVCSTQWKMLDIKHKDYDYVTSWPNYGYTKYELNNDYVMIKRRIDAHHGNGKYAKDRIYVNTNIYYQNGKLFAKYKDELYGHISEIELTSDWRAFSTYDEVCAFQQSEKIRLAEIQKNNDIKEEEIDKKIKELVNHAKEVLEETRKFNSLTNSPGSKHVKVLEKFIKDYYFYFL